MKQRSTMGKTKKVEKLKICGNTKSFQSVAAHCGVLSQQRPSLQLAPCCLQQAPRSARPLTCGHRFLASAEETCSTHTKTQVSIYSTSADTLPRVFTSHVRGRCGCLTIVERAARTFIEFYVVGGVESSSFRAGNVIYALCKKKKQKKHIHKSFIETATSEQGNKGNLAQQFRNRY